MRQLGPRLTLRSHEISAWILKKLGFYRGSTSKPPQQRRQAQHQLPLDRIARVIARDHGRFKTPIILNILYRLDHGFGRQSMPERRFAAIFACPPR